MSEKTLQEVSKEEYYNFIADKNVKLSVEGDYPYTCIWKEGYNNVVAKCVESYPEGGIYPTVEKYFILK